MDQRRLQNVLRTKNLTHGVQLSVPLTFLAHFDVFCALLLYRPVAMIFLVQKRKFSFIRAHMPNKPSIEWDKSKVITTNQHYHQCLCLEAWHINSAHAPLNHVDGGLLTDAYLYLVKKRQLISYNRKGLLVAVCRSPLMKALQECGNVGFMNCNFFGYIH